jgi:hypothetical protein
MNKITDVVTQIGNRLRWLYNKIDNNLT